MGPGPTFCRSDESAAHPSMPGVLRDDERRQPCDITFCMYGGKCVGGSQSDHLAIDLGDEGFRPAPLREARQAARHISSVGWISELSEQTAQGRCVPV